MSGPSRAEGIVAQLGAVRERIARAAEQAGRDPDSVELIAVSKAHPASAVRAAWDAGQRLFGENYVQDWLGKCEDPNLSGLTGLRWHFIGHLQRNKARRVLKRAEVVHSVDSMALTSALARICAEENWQREIYLQLNLTGEEAKHGMQTAECEEALALAVEADHLQVLGLMGMAPLAPTDQCSADSVFHTMNRLARQLESDGASRFATGNCGLSMGMSSDLEAAVSAGSTCLRIGSDLYAESAEGAL